MEDKFNDYLKYESEARLAANQAKKSFGKPPQELNNPELDHIVPVKVGFEQRIPINVISLHENLQWIEREENRSKGDDLTDEGKKMIQSWKDRHLIKNSKVKSAGGDKDFSFKEIIDATIKNKYHTAFIPLSANYKISAVWCQRDETLRYEKTLNALGDECLSTHKIIHYCVYPDGKIQRCDGNTRTYIFLNNLMNRPTYVVPEILYGIFHYVENEEAAEKLYHSFDSSDTAETFTEKLSGYMRAHGLNPESLPKKWRKGEQVYDIAIVALDGYKNHSMPRTKSDAEKAKVTADKLSIFISDLVDVGIMFNAQKIKPIFTSPLIGTFIRFMLKYKNDKAKFNKLVNAYDFLISYYSTTMYTPWHRPTNLTVPEYRNLFIMLDELQTSESIGQSSNPWLKSKNIEVSSRRIINDYATKTTANQTDRQMYCGWITYCLNKFLNEHVMNEDIILDVTDKAVNPAVDTAVTVSKQVQIARNNIIGEYIKFWNTP